MSQLAHVTRHVHTTTAATLPLLVHHGFHSRPHFGRLRPVGNHPHLNKPAGGLLAYPAIDPPGSWRPWPHDTAWSRWCHKEDCHDWLDGYAQAKLHPHRQAVLAVIDSAADARALSEAAVRSDSTAHLAALTGVCSTLYHGLIDWPRLRDWGLSGVYLTPRGLSETRRPQPGGGPLLYGWDMPTVWFCQPHYRLGSPWRYRSGSRASSLHLGRTAA